MPRYLAPCPHDKRGTQAPSPQGFCILGCLRSRTWINTKWSVVGCQARKHVWGYKPRHSPGYRTQASPGSWDAQRLTWALCDPVYYPTPNLHNPHWVVLRSGRAKKGTSQPQMWWGVSGSRNSGYQGSRYGYGKEGSGGHSWWLQNITPSLKFTVSLRNCPKSRLWAPQAVGPAVVMAHMSAP